MSEDTYTEYGFLLITDDDDGFYPRFYKHKDHFGLVSVMVQLEEEGHTGVECKGVFLGTNHFSSTNKRE